jgi:hypothetical protein
MTRKKLDEKIIEIGNAYHGRMCSPTISGMNRDRVCGCCEGLTRTQTGIEHDSQDHSKDLWVCIDCMSDLYKYWQNNEPRKIPPC